MNIREILSAKAEADAMVLAMGKRVSLTDDEAKELFDRAVEALSLSTEDLRYTSDSYYERLHEVFAEILKLRVFHISSEKHGELFTGDLAAAKARAEELDAKHRPYAGFSVVDEEEGVIVHETDPEVRQEMRHESLETWLEAWESAVEDGQSRISREEAIRRYRKYEDE